MKKQITNHNLQYWLYAILVKQFGKKIQLQRNLLARRYHSMRHDFNVRNINYETTKKFLISKLQESGFGTSFNSKNCLTKTVTINGITSEIYIYLGQNGDELSVRGLVERHE